MNGINAKKTVDRKNKNFSNFFQFPTFISMAKINLRENCVYNAFILNFHKMIFTANILNHKKEEKNY